MQSKAVIPDRAELKSSCETPQCSQKQRIPKRLQKADGIAGEQLLIIGKTDEGFRSDALPIKKAVVHGRADGRDQYAAEQDQRRQQKDQDVKFVAVYFVHGMLPPHTERRPSQIPGQSERDRLLFMLCD